MRSNIREGATFPDYELPDHEGELRRLSELQGANPMVLHLSRGGFDPKEHRFVRKLADASLDFRVAYTRVVVISTDNQLDINEFRDSVGAEWPFLSDPGADVATGPRHPGVHGPGSRPDDPPHVRARARLGNLQDLQRLLVLGTAVA
jgi:peroxiredoxin